MQNRKCFQWIVNLLNWNNKSQISNKCVSKLTLAWWETIMPLKFVHLQNWIYVVQLLMIYLLPCSVAMCHLCAFVDGRLWLFLVCLFILSCGPHLLAWSMVDVLPFFSQWLFSFIHLQLSHRVGPHISLEAWLIKGTKSQDILELLWVWLFFL